VRTSLRALILAGLLAAASRGQEKPSADAVSGSIANEKTGAVLRLKGAVPRWPDHAFAFVKVFVKDGPDIDWYKLELKDGSYAGTFGFGARKTAPMVYRAELWLRVGLQSSGVRAWFMREYGVPKDHAEVVDACELSSGTPDEQKAFRRGVLKKCEGWLARARATSDKAAAALDKEAKTADWEKTKAALTDETTKLQDDYLAFEKDWVTLGREALRLKEIKDVVVTTFKVLENAKDDPDTAREGVEQAKAAIEKAASSIETTRTELGASPDKDR
jgi:flagellin-like hook-associated protein FlgL